MLLLSTANYCNRWLYSLVLFYIFGKESDCFARVGGVPAEVAL